MDKFQCETPWSIFALGKLREGYSETLHTLHTSEAIEKAGRKPGPKKDIIQSSKAIRMLILLLHVNFNLLVHWPFLYRGKLGHRSSQASPFPSSIPPRTEKTSSFRVSSSSIPGKSSSWLSWSQVPISGQTIPNREQGPGVSNHCSYRNQGNRALWGQFPKDWVSFPSGTVVKNPPANVGDTREVGLLSGLGRSLVEGNGNPLQ